MIGRAPLMGQVRLVSPRLAQSQYEDINQTTEFNITSTNTFLDRLEALARELPQAPKLTILNEIAECRARVDTLRTAGDNINTLNSIMDNVRACTAGVRKQIDDQIALLQVQGVSTGTPATTTNTQPSEGIPTWALVAGGVAAAGILVYLSSR